jgi:hypothetical protein
VQEKSVSATDYTSTSDYNNSARDYNSTADYNSARELFFDGGRMESIRLSRIGMAMSPEPGDRASRIGIAMSPEPSKRFSVPRKEVSSPPGYSTPTQRASYDAYGEQGQNQNQDQDQHQNQSQNQNQHQNQHQSLSPSSSQLDRESRLGRESQMSGILRGPVPEMYAYGGEAIETDEELARLEEEEQRIDEAIRESERLALMRREREAVRARIQQVRKSSFGMRDNMI